MNPDRNKLPLDDKLKSDFNKINSNTALSSTENEIIMPVIEEFLTVKKEIIETGKISISKSVESEMAHIDLPLVNESYHIERISVDSDLLESRPTTIERDGNMIIPVVREVPVTVIKYQVIEEIHITMNQTIVPHQQEIELLKDKVEIKRSSLNE